MFLAGIFGLASRPVFCANCPAEEINTNVTSSGQRGEEAYGKRMTKRSGFRLGRTFVLHNSINVSELARQAPLYFHFVAIFMQIRKKL